MPRYNANFSNKARQRSRQKNFLFSQYFKIP